MDEERLRMTRKCFIFLLVGFAAHAEGPQFRYGKYIGGIQMDGISGQFATTLDTFIVQPAETTAFPRVHATLKTSLGGFSSSEYLSFHFEKPTYNFEENILYLDDPNLDITGALHLIKTPSGIALEGPITHRPSQRTGKIFVQMDEEEGELSKVGFQVPYVPKLAGEYLGECGGEKSALQIETGKNSNLDRSARTGLEGYIIMGRMGNWEERYQEFLTARTYSFGIYYLFDGKLELQGPRGTLGCSVVQAGLNCKHTINTKPQTCHYKKKVLEGSPPQFFKRRFFLKLTPSQKAALPEVNPPENKELLQALRGNFYGYLHHENRDQYQPAHLSVISTTSTENPHNPNEVFITTSLSALYGSSWAAPQVGQEFSRRTFYLRPGFTLEGPNADTFLVIDEWKKEFIRGVWYSKSFGRVGTFELLKGIKPELPKSFSVNPSLEGQYLGPTDRTPETNEIWWLQATVPPQIPPFEKSTVSLRGEFQLRGAISLSRAFESGAYDIYTNNFNWVNEEEKSARLFTGTVSSQQELKIVWPGAPLFLVHMKNYGPYTYRRVVETPEGTDGQ
jgi:hypothetical protein